ncbi:hypothetical protein IMCC20628_00863 [Hoeflea sp. IMCC20628]|uniref:hypothetical protein n=1 Tax=Hoeflea sp. IMCC20628 TaxID=1620421 RepID=UPI00063AA2CB|nr:hypothetical protein [Hoeflea sp. IMCC20628]AKH99582.1 hypothetical protein IMCC20628_00863 [Hoeflea sp. IMCC20628]
MADEKQGATRPRLVAGFALIFGVLTIVSGGRVLFGGPEAQAAAGKVVPFVLWFNFLSGFAYVGAALGIARHKDWARRLSAGLAVAIVAVFALFGWHIFAGGAYEMRTVGAMILRSAVWVGIAIYLQHCAKAASLHS